MKLKRWMGFFLMYVACNCVYGQYPSRDGNFQVDQIKGCAPLTINVSVPIAVCDPPNGKPCDFFYEGNPFQNVFTWTFTTPGVYDVIGIFQGGIPSDKITITVLPNTAPTFEIYSCGGNEVQVKVTDTSYDQYVINYNDASAVKVVPKGNLAKDNHTFAASGNKTITVRGRNLGADDNCTPSNKVVNAVSTLPTPSITKLTVLSDKDIQLDFTNQPNILYKLEIAVNGSASFQQLQNVYEVSTTTINNLRTDDNFYCFRLGAFDPCNNVMAYSNTICSSNFDLNILNNDNQLAWVTSSTGVSNYSISKNTGPPLVAPSTATKLDDTNTICGTNYCYQQTTNYSNGSKSISLQKCGKAISTDIPTVVQNISSIVGSTASVQLRWTQDPAFNAKTYSVAKYVDGSFVLRDTTSTTAYTDSEYASDVTSCYTLNYEDVCNNKSPVSVDVCPIKVAGSLQENNAVNLSWNAYAGWANGVDHYIVEKFNEQGQLLSSTNAGTATTYVDSKQDLSNQVVVYRITAIANGGGIVPSVSNTLTIIKDPNLFYPTAFTPNGDGLNDIFNVFGQFISLFEMRIFNRWGEMLYTTEDIDQGWNGIYKGTLMPEGTYVFRATITDQAGRTFDRSGTIVLLRKN